MKKLVISLIVFSFILIPNLWAEGTANSVWDAAKSPDYGRKFTGMLGRGLINIATCFVDLIVHTVDGTKEGPPFVGSLTGLGSGIGCTALRVTSGALDIVTFWVPDFNGFPVSRSYHNCLEEEQTGVSPQETGYLPPEEAPVHRPEDYAKPAGRRDAMDYVKK